jgi:4-hydroxybenzoate polyprenyltransferase
MDATLTLATPLTSRLRAWLQERFPAANALLFFTLYLATAAVARAATGSEIALTLQDALGCLVTWSFFLLLRVFDEHKDYELDCRNHPQRVLQSGLVTLQHLKVLGGLAIALQLVVSLWLDGGIGRTTQAWALLFAWTCLMGREFFVGEWLTRHLTTYAVSHMLVMPLIVWWLAQLALPGSDLTPALQWLMGLAFVSGFCFEITRKTKGPEEERASVESYSRIFGTRGAAVVVMALVSAMVACQLWLMQVLAGATPLWAAALLAVCYALGLRQLLAFLKAPSAAARGKNEALVALTMLGGYALLIAVVLTQQGLALRWF